MHSTCTNQFAPQIFGLGGGERDRTDDPLLAKQVLSQLSYTPNVWMVGLVGFEPTTPALSRRCSNRLSYRPISGQHAVKIAADKSERLNLNAYFQKGGDPAAPSDTATLLRLHPSHEPCRGNRPPYG